MEDELIFYKEYETKTSMILSLLSLFLMNSCTMCLSIKTNELNTALQDIINWFPRNVRII